MSDSVVFYRSFYEAIQGLKATDKAKVYDAIMAYALDGIEPQLTGVCNSIFILIKPQIDANEKRRTNGSKGGRPKKDEEKTNGYENEKPMVSKNDENKKPMVIENDAEVKTETKPNVNANANVNVNANVNDNDVIYARSDKTASEPAISLPTNKTGEKYPVDHEQVEEWTSLYPAVDVMQELRNMVGWLQGNPTKRKTKGGMPRFINSWLAREQNKGGSKEKPKNNSKLAELESYYLNGGTV